MFWKMWRDPLTYFAVCFSVSQVLPHQSQCFITSRQRRASWRWQGVNLRKPKLHLHLASSVERAQVKGLGKKTRRKSARVLFDTPSIILRKWHRHEPIHVKGAFQRIQGKCHAAKYYALDHLHVHTQGAMPAELHKTDAEVHTHMRSQCMRTLEGTTIMSQINIQVECTVCFSGLGWQGW